MSSRNIITQISRVLVGLLFIFSGFIKANDPLGFTYKLDEYFTVFGLNTLFQSEYLDFSFVPLFLSIAICVFEIFLGISLLLGIYRKFTVWMLLLMIIFFTFLTFYSAVFNKVTDCGCFGDFLKLTPWTSFGKDVVLLVLIIILFVNRNLINPLFDPKAAKTLAWVLLIPTIMFPLYSWYYLPPLDFRPYAIGKDLKKQMEVPPGAVTDSFVQVFIYENLKTGKHEKISYKELMAGKVTDETQWKWVETQSDQVRVGYKPPIHDFRIMKGSDTTNLTPQFLKEPGYRLMIIHYNITTSKAGVQDKVNALVNELEKDGKVKVWGFSGSSEALNVDYRQKYKVPYDFYTLDPTVMKTIIRSNPGLVLLKDNQVVGMWPASALPDKEDIYSHMK